MKKDLSVLICESILLEFDPITMAAGGAALGAGVNAAKWVKERLALRREMQGCRGNPDCVTGVKSKIAVANRNAIASGVKHAALGGVMGGFAGTQTGSEVGSYALGAAKKAAGAVGDVFQQAAPGIVTQMTMVGTNQAVNAANRRVAAQDANVQKAAEVVQVANKKLEDTKERAATNIGQVKEAQKNSQQSVRNGETRQVQNQGRTAPTINR